MIFNINRASDGGSRPKPCDEAFLVDGFWSININSIDELMTLIRGCGLPVVVAKTIDPKSEGPAEASITIYDDYLE